MATRRESTDTDTRDDIEESTGSAQTQPLSAVLFNTFDILGYHDTISASELKNLRQQLQLSSPTLDRPISTISQSSSGSFLASTSNQCPQSKIYLDLDDKSYSVILADGPQPASTILTDLDDTAVKESHNSVENIRNLSKIQDQHGEDMALYPARKKYRGDENFYLINLMSKAFLALLQFTGAKVQRFSNYFKKAIKCSYFKIILSIYYTEKSE